MTDTDTTMLPEDSDAEDTEPRELTLDDFFETDNRHVPVPPAIAALFARAAARLDALPNTKKLERMFESDDAAETFRKQAVTWAEEHNRSCTLPKHIPAHTIPAKVEEGTGKILRPEKRVPDNKVPAHYNVGRHVIFRFSKVREDQPAVAPVTESRQEPKPAEKPATPAAMRKARLTSRAS